MKILDFGLAQLMPRAWVAAGERPDLRSASQGCTGNRDFKLEQQAAARAAQKGLAEGARLVLAKSRALEGWALERLGQPDKAAAAFAEAHDLYSKGGDRHGAAAALHRAGNMLYDRGDYTGARKNYEQALAVYRSIDAQRSTASAYDNLGNVLYDLGQLAAAKSYYEQTLAIAREIGAKDVAAGALGNIANVLGDMGQLEEARKKQQERLQAFREVGNKTWRGFHAQQPGRFAGGTRRSRWRQTRL